MSKQVIDLYIIALMLPMVLVGSDSQATPINYKPISSSTPPCGKHSQENCVTHRPPANEQQRPCNPSDHCRGVKSLTGSESMSKAQVSAATKQFGAQDYTLLNLVLQFMLARCSFFFSVLSVFGKEFMSK